MIWESRWGTCSRSWVRPGDQEIYWLSVKLLFFFALFICLFEAIGSDSTNHVLETIFLIVEGSNKTKVPSPADRYFYLWWSDGIRWQFRTSLFFKILNKTSDIQSSYTLSFPLLIISFPHIFYAFHARNRFVSAKLHTYKILPLQVGLIKAGWQLGEVMVN